MSRSGDPLRSAAEVFRWAESFTNLERLVTSTDQRDYRLDRMALLLGRFGSPHRGPRIVHVAGTKGKGSTAALIASALHAAGFRTGAYLSPHVLSAFERIQVMGEREDEARLVRSAGAVKEYVDTIPAEGLPGHFALTTFELLTLIAFLYYRDAGCTDVVVEVGIGGRLDATNVVTPVASVITPLDLEHTELLGDTIEKIAFEKGGIIKDGVPAFSAAQLPGPREVFRGIAAERGSALSFVDDEAALGDVRVDRAGTSFSLALRGEPREAFQLALVGAFQAENAALAYLALRRTRPEISAAMCRAGFAAVRLPGRMELRDGKPPILLDGAHTPLAVDRLLASFQEIFPGEAVLLFGSVAGKNPDAMAAILAPAFSSIVISTPGTFKESDPRGVAALFGARNPATFLEPDPARALARARELAAGRPVLVTGSFYMVAEIRRLL
jgi:dihydrofolate synthase / folylpolyglutamate synthase